MSRRNDLKDSDSEDSDDGGGGRTVTPDISDFFTNEEIEAINKCKIQTNDNWGIYSDDCISRAIAKVGMPPLELVVQDEAVHLYQKHRVVVESLKVFYDRDIYKVHSAKSDDCDPECLEEAILLEIETIRRSEKAVKIRLFKNKETGGMVVFGPWFNYALQRLLRLSSNETGRSLGDYTAVKIIRSLFSFITEDLKEVIKPGRLLELKTKMGVDWEGNMKAARKVINYCGGSAHFLHNELTIVEAYVESLKSMSQKKSAAAADLKSPASNTAAEPAPSKQAGVNDGRKKRMEAMKALATAHLPGQPVAPSHTSVAASPSANDGWGRTRAGESAAQPHIHARATSHDGSNSTATNRESSTSEPYNPNDRAASLSNDRSAPCLGTASNGWGRVRDGNSAIQPSKARGSWTFARSMMGANIPFSREPVIRDGMSAPQSHNYSCATSDEGFNSTATIRESSNTQSYNSSRATMATSNQTYNPNDRAASQSNDNLTFIAPSRGSASNEWGRGRDGNSAIQSSKARGSWTFARGMLDSNIQVNNAQNFDNPVPQQEAFARAPGQLPIARAASRDNISTRDDYAHDQELRSENRCGNMNNAPSPSDNYSSRSVGDSSFGRYDDRGSDGGRDDRAYRRSGSRGGGREDYPYSNTREGSGSRDASRGEEYRSLDDRCPDGGRDDLAYHRSGSRGGGRDAYPYSNSREGSSSRDIYRGEEYRSSSRDGSYRDYSGHPAQGSKHNRSDDYDGRDTRPEKMYKADSAGASRGRGAHVNQPAWMIKQMQTSAHDGPTGMPGVIGVTANSFAAMAGANTNNTSSLNAPGSGTGRGMDMNPPASISLSDMGRFVPAPGSASPAPATHATAQHSVGESSTNGHGRGRGRGRGVNKTLPAWMTNP